MSHDEAIEKSKEFLYLVDKPFLNSNGEKETVKAVVAWEEKEGDWQPHVCFYNWATTNQGQMSHMKVEDFLQRYQLINEGTGDRKSQRRI